MINDNFIFSIVIAVYNTEKYVAEAIESIINQSFDFDKVQLILVDDGSIDGSGDICKYYCEQFPKNIKYIYQDNAGQSIARNNGLNYVEGKYVNFLDSDDKLELNALEEVFNFFTEYDGLIDVVSTPRFYFEAKNNPLSSNYRFYKTRVVDVNLEYNAPQFAINSTFIRYDALSFRFNPKLIVSEDAELVNKIILKKMKYGVVNTTKYLYRKRFDEDSSLDTRKIKKEYYIPRLKYYFEELINYSIENLGYVPKYIQFVLMFDLQWMFGEDIIQNILDENEVLEFHNHLHGILQHISDEIILSQKFFDSFLKKYVLSLKYPDLNLNIDFYNSNLFLKYGDVTIDKLNNHKIDILNMDINNDILYLKCCFDSCFDNIMINAFCNGNSINICPISGIERYSMGHQISNRFYFEIELLLVNDSTKISFNVSYESHKFDILLHNNSCSLLDFKIKNNELFIYKSNQISPFDNQFDEYEKNEIFTLWISDEDCLSELAYLSLKSMLLVEHNVILYSYKHLNNVPRGVIVKDANEIVDESKVFRYKNGRKSYSGFANYFRLKRIYEMGGTWLDLDIILIRNINDVIKKDIIICSEPHHMEYIHCNNAILRFPKHDPFVKEMYEYAEKRGKDVNHGETGPHLITKLIFSEYPDYSQFITSPSFNNLLGWWEISHYFDDPDLLLFNLDLSNIVGFHFVNTFFSSMDVKNNGVFDSLKQSIVNSNSKQEYEINLYKNKILSSHNVYQYQNLLNLNKLISNNVEYTFIIDCKLITKLDLYLILGSIEKNPPKSFEFIICGKTDIIKDRLLFKDYTTFINSFDVLINNFEDYIHGKKVIPINSKILFRKNWYKKINENNFDIVSLNLNTFNLNVFTFDSFHYVLNQFSDEIFNFNIFELNYKYDIKELKDLNISHFTYNFSYQEIELMQLIDEIHLNADLFQEIKHKIFNIFDKYDSFSNLSYYYISQCINILKSNTFLEFNLFSKQDDLYMFLCWNHKVNEYLLESTSKKLFKTKTNLNDISNNLNELNVSLNNYKLNNIKLNETNNDYCNQIEELKELNNDYKNKLNNYKNNLLSLRCKLDYMEYKINNHNSSNRKNFKKNFFHLLNNE